MALSKEQTIGIIVVIVLILGYVLYSRRQQPYRNIRESMGNVQNTDTDTVSNGSSEDSCSNDVSTESGSVPSCSVDSSDESSATVSAVPPSKRVEINRGKNANRTGTYKSVSYKEGSRGGSGEIDRFFMDGDVGNATENREFSPMDDVSEKLAAYVPKKSDEGLLPVEEKDWFEDVTPTRIKNRHLINIYRPVGVNTISTSLKNPSLDIRGNPANPKTVVSPFLNSSIEPDHNIRGLCVD